MLRDTAVIADDAKIIRLWRQARHRDTAVIADKALTTRKVKKTGKTIDKCYHI